VKLDLGCGVQIVRLEDFSERALKDRMSYSCVHRTWVLLWGSMWMSINDGMRSAIRLAIVEDRGVALYGARFVEQLLQPYNAFVDRATRHHR
jgi:hypothetical protein